jgi:hypothetical protein
MRKNEEYRRLPGRSGLFVRHSLWLRPDHVLCVRRYPFSEEYRRYYFADIQALVLTELSNTAFYYGAGLGAALLLLTAVLAFQHPVWASFWAFVALLVFLVTSRRPNCACYVKTIVGTEKLLALRRLRAARKSVPMLTTEIEHAQGSLTRETLETQISLAGPAPAAAKPALPHYGGLAHWVLFPLVLLRGALGAVVLSASLYSMPFSLAGSAVSAAVLLMALIAAVKQHRTDMARGVRRLVYAILGWYALSTVSTVIVTIYLIVQLGPKASNASFNSAIIIEHPVMKYLQLINVVILFMTGCTGLILLWLHSSSTRTPPELAVGNDGLEAG